MSQPLLFSHRFNPVKEEKIYHTGRIKITSPEQFVPLFLVNYGQGAFDKFPTQSSYFLKPSADQTGFVSSLGPAIGNDTGKNIELLVQRNARDVAKLAIFKDLKNILSSPLPKEYTFADLNVGMTNADIRRLFLGEIPLYNAILCRKDFERVLTGLGIICYLSVSQNYNTIKSSYYRSIPLTRLETKIIPQVLIVIKYKQLARARASFYLQQPMDIPLTDIKLLRTHSWLNSISRDGYLLQINPIIESVGIPVFVTSPVEMEKYLFLPNISLTPEQYLARAKASLNNVEPHVVF